jgi:hypothetical protein
MLSRRANRQVRGTFAARKAPGMNATKNDIKSASDSKEMAGAKIK